MDQIHTGIVEIYGNEEKKYLGMGFLADDKTIITCRHVIDKKEVSVFYIKLSPYSEHEWAKADAHIIDDEKLDISYLKLEKEIPPKSKPVRLFKVDSYKTHDNDPIEFIVHKKDNNKWELIKGKIGYSIQNEIKIYPDKRFENYIEPGISGSLVSLDTKEKDPCYIGMVFYREHGTEVTAITSEDIISFCRDKNIYINIKYIDWYHQATYIRKLLYEFGDDVLSDPLDNIKFFRIFLRDANLLGGREIEALNQMCMFIMDQWEMIRIRSINSPGYPRYNYSVCDDTHSILVEEKLYRLLISDLDTKETFEGIIQSYKRNTANYKDMVDESTRKLKRMCLALHEMLDRCWS